MSVISAVSAISVVSLAVPYGASHEMSTLADIQRTVKREFTWRPRQLVHFCANASCSGRAAEQNFSEQESATLAQKTISLLNSILNKDFFFQKNAKLKGSGEATEAPPPGVTNISGSWS